MQVEIKGDNLVITLPLNKEGKPSASGKSLTHASTNGNKETNVKMANGKMLVVGVNAYTSNK